jgi:hypothetical protein
MYEYFSLADFLCETVKPFCEESLHATSRDISNKRTSKKQIASRQSSPHFVECNSNSIRELSGTERSDWKPYKKIGKKKEHIWSCIVSYVFPYISISCPYFEACIEGISTIHENGIEARTYLDVCKCQYES